VVAGDSGGSWNLWIAGVSSGRLSRLTDDEAREENPSWSKVTGDILYTVEEKGGRSIFLLEPETKRVIRFGKSGPTPIQDSEPAWSPDARWVAFVSDRQGSKDLYVAPVGAGEARRLAELPGNESHPTWSPDGKWIAFARDQGKGSEIWKIPVEGGAPVQITHLKEGVTGDSQPHWSPAGSWIAFTRSLASPPGASDVYIISPDGGAPFPFRRGSGARISDPAWSPDGGHLAYCFSTPDQLYIVELGEPPAPSEGVPGLRGTPAGKRLGERTPQGQPPAPEPPPPAPEDPNQD
jgi:TolB protein